MHLTPDQIFPPGIVETELPGVGGTAQRIELELAKIFKGKESTVSYGWRSRLKSEALTAMMESKNRIEPGWVTISFDTLRQTEQIIDSLVDSVVDPAIFPDDEGALNLEWNRNNETLLTISICDGTLHYSLIDGPNENHRGLKKFGHEAPSHIINRMVQEKFS